MRVDSTADRLELRFTVATGGCLVVALITAAIPLGIAVFMLFEPDPLPAFPAAGVGIAILGVTFLGGRLTRSRVVLDRLANEARVERRGLAAEDAPGRGGVHAAIGPLDAVEGAEVLEEPGSEGATSYKPALRIRGQKSIALTSYGSGARGEADEAVRVLREWLGHAG